MQGVSIPAGFGRCALAAGMALALAAAPSRGEESVRNTPFGYGEDVPDLVASCEDIRSWAAKAPDTQVRITMVIRGKLSRVSGDEALVYLTMCEAPQPKVTCVTYKRNGMSAGDVVTFAGGYRQVNPDSIVLDPCLASRR